MRVIAVTLLFAVTVFGRVAAEPAYLAESDRLSYLGEYAKSVQLLTGKLLEVSTATAQAEIYWRLARDTLDLGDARARTSGSAQKELPLFERSERYSDRAIALDPTNAKGYFWKAASVGRTAQVRNLLRAFFKAGDVRKLLFEAARLAPSDGEIWYVLAQLYSQIPGFPFSFGNASYAVSLGRKGIDARKAQVAKGVVANVPADYSIQLARELVRRGWSKAERARMHTREAGEYRRTANPITKNFYYEGVVEIPSLSDRQEAIRIETAVAARLRSVANRTPTQEQDLRKALRDLKQLGH